MVKTTIYLPDDIHEILRRKAFDEKSSMSQIIVEALQFPMSSDPVRITAVEEIKHEPGEVIEKPMCDKQFCKARSEGKYLIIADDGETELNMNLCTYHWHQARKEGEVRAL